METTTRVNVQGMSCGHCVASVTDELTKIEGVTNVEVDLASGDVSISSDEPIATAAISAAIEEAGYEVTR